MNVERALTYVFEDETWLTKVAVGGVLFFVPVFGWFVAVGYWLRLTRQVYLGADLPLPEWNDFGGDFVRGLKAFVAGLIWALPIILIAASWVCLLIVSIVASDSDSSAGAGLGLLVGLGSLILYVGLFALQIVLMFLQPLILSRLALTESIGRALAIGETLREARRYPAPLLIVLGLQLALSFLASLGFFLCFIGIVFSTFLTYLMQAHLYGQLRRQIEGASPSEPVPLAV